MFDVGFWELLFIMTLALLVLGPEKLPGLVSGLGRMLGRARAVARGLKLQIEREMAMNPTTRGSEPPKRPAAGSTARASEEAKAAKAASGPAGEPGLAPEAGAGSDIRSAVETEAAPAPGSPPASSAAESSPEAGDSTEDERRRGT